MLRNRLQNKKLKISESIIKFWINILYLISETNPLIPDLDKIEITLEALSSGYYNVINVKWLRNKFEKSKVFKISG